MQATTQDIAATNAPPRAPGSSWRIAAVAMVLPLSALVVLYWPTVTDLIGLWSDLNENAYGHGFLVCAISLYLIWRQRHALSVLNPDPDLRGLAPIAALSMVWMLGALVDVLVVQVAVMVPLLLAVVWTVLGTAVARQLLFPLLYLFFAIPVWELLLPMLQGFTTEVVFRAIRTAGAPALLDGHTVVLPVGQFAIEHSCSGLRYLLASLALGTLYAFFNYTQLWARVLVVLVAAATAILANLARVFLVIYMGYRTEMRHPWVHDHVDLGWALYGGLVVLLLVIDTMIHRRSRAVGTGGTLERANQQGPRPGSARRLVVAALLGLCVAAIGPVAAQAIKHRSDPIPSGVIAPAGLSPWVGPQAAPGDWRPTYPGVAVSLNTRYRSGTESVELYIGYYTRQDQGRELVSEINSLGDGRRWRVDRQRSRPHTPTGLPVTEGILISEVGRRRLAWHWYHVMGEDLTDRYRAKLLQLWGLLTGRPDAALVAVATDIGPDGEEAARARLNAFVKTMRPAIGQTLADAQGTEP